MGANNICLGAPPPFTPPSAPTHPLLPRLHVHSVAAAHCYTHVHEKTYLILGIRVVGKFLQGESQVAIRVGKISQQEKEVHPPTAIHSHPDPPRARVLTHRQHLSSNEELQAPLQGVLVLSSGGRGGHGGERGKAQGLRTESRVNQPRVYRSAQASRGARVARLA